MVDGGAGVFNGIYVDNLVEAIRLSLEKPEAAGQILYVGDAETADWAEVYSSLGSDAGSLPSVTPPPPASPSFSDQIRGWTAGAFGRKVMPLIPRQAKSKVKRLLAALPEPPGSTAWTQCPDKAPVEVDFEISWLQKTRWRFSSDRAADILGYRPLVTFVEGMRRTRDWLEFPHA